jgi:hypothetical protein
LDVSDQFAVMVDAAMRAKGWKTYQLSAAIGLLPSGRAINPTQVQRILDNRRANLTREIVDRLIEVLDLDPFDAYEAADLRPRDFTAEDHRTFVTAGGTRTAELQGPFTSRRTGSPGRRLALVPPPDLRGCPVERIPA